MIIAAAAVVALAQMYQSEKANKASKARLAGIKRAFDALVPPKYNLSPMDAPDFLKGQASQVQFDFSKMTPEDFAVVGKYAPDVAPFIAEKNPKLIEQTAASREGRQAQVEALRKMKAMAAGGQDPELQQAMDDAGQRSQIEAQSRNKSILQDAERRGVMDSGTTLAANLAASSDSMKRSADDSRAAAVASYKNKAQALRDSASLGGDINRSEIDLESRNTGILNDFNERTARTRQDWENRRTDEINHAKVRNLEEEQRVADANVHQRNDFAVNERNRLDRMNTEQYERDWNERTYQNDLRGKTADWYKGERDRADNLADRQYTYDFNKLAGANGVAYKQDDRANQAAADRNNQIQGVGNMAMSGYMYKSQNDRQDATQDREDRRARYEKTGSWDEE